MAPIDISSTSNANVFIAGSTRVPRYPITNEIKTINHFFSTTTKFSPTDSPKIRILLKAPFKKKCNPNIHNKTP